MNSVTRKPSLGVGRFSKSMYGTCSVTVASLPTLRPGCLKVPLNAEDQEPRGSFDGRQDRCAFVLRQEDEELCRRGVARVSADDVHVVGALIEGLAWPQCDGCSTSDLHHDGSLQDVDERLRVMGMYRVRVSWRVLDRDHREFPTRNIFEIRREE